MNPNSPPEDVLAYCREVVPPWWARQLLNPIGWPYFSLLGLAFTWILWEARVPQAFGAAILGGVIFLSFGIVLLLRLIVRGTLCFVYKKGWPGFRRRSWRFAIPIALGLLLVILVNKHVPEFMAWQWSEPALRQMAEDILAKETATPASASAVHYPNRRAGLYDLDEITYWPDSRTVQFYIKGAGFLNRCGYAYNPLGPPVSPSSTAPQPATFTCVPLSGPWYTAEENW